MQVQIKIDGKCFIKIFKGQLNISFLLENCVYSFDDFALLSENEGSMSYPLRLTGQK